MGVMRRYSWLSFGLLLACLALASCSRSGLNDETDSFAYRSALDRLKEETADLSCNSDSDCQVFTDLHFCPLFNVTYSNANISEPDVKALVDSVQEARSARWSCPMIYVVPFDDKTCVNSICEFKVKEKPF
jgi:hypothetical protein